MKILGKHSASVAALLICLGCRGSETDPGIVPTAPVNGVLKYQGKPLEYHQVLFTPEAGGRGATAVTDQEGRFVAGTNAAGDGAPIGKSKVSVVYVGPPTNFEPGKEPLNYRPPAPAVKIPAKYQTAAKSGLTVEVPESGLQDYQLDLE